MTILVAVVTCHLYWSVISVYFHVSLSNRRVKKFAEMFKGGEVAVIANLPFEFAKFVTL